MRRRFFVDRFESDSAILHGETAEHLGRVLRAEPGQLYELSDGDLVWLAKIETVAIAKRGDSRIDFSLVEQIPATPPRLNIELLLSIVKFDRFEWCLEKATELGATTIIPLAAARTDRPLIAAAGKRHDRWQRILVESAQQARRLRTPVFQQASSPERAFSESSADLKILLSENQSAPSIRVGLGAASNVKTVSLAIGPEGGWTESEFAAAQKAKFLEASLGENILRTETAVISALAVLRFALDD
jgi:16S rRNA (uracil1498-N3)-methyltransferase